VLGRAALFMDEAAGTGGARIVEDRVNTLSFTIAAGTSQIQRNILAERVLDLPREPRWT
jgi:alkylation response protein AidB-like acyl-CoA dehydrogenase